MLEPSEDVHFLFEITNQIKEFYETAVIFVTRKDFSEPIFNALCFIRTALREKDKTQLIDVIVDFHLQWLGAVAEIENFTKLLEGDFSKEDFFHAITFSVDAMVYRLKNYQKYMEKNKSTLPTEKQNYIQADLEIVEEMHNEVTVTLLGKLKTFSNYICFEEYKTNVSKEVDVLLQWLDKNYDGLVIKLSKYVNVYVPHLKGDLTKTLQQIVDELRADKKNPNTIDMLENLKKKGKEIEALIRCTVGHNLELRKVFEKINVLEDRIDRLEQEPTSAAVVALKRKREYLKKRVASLENLKTTLKCIHELTEIKLSDDNSPDTDNEKCVCKDFYQLRVFNHELPLANRERLVTELCCLWDLAIFGERSRHSMISILSATGSEKAEFTDEIGTFFVDEYSRKIYKLPDNDTLFQPNERGELVPISDDANHVYYYDDCGRYFVDSETNHKTYKAHANASEYIMDQSGMLLKVKEEKDGTVYYFDSCGRYYINDSGKQIYQDEDHLSEYENDGLGNLVRIRSQLDIFQPCPADAHVTEDFSYLKETVGQALRICVAEVLLHEPPDPIKYLSMSLVKYRENMEVRERNIRDKEELDVEREIIAAEERAEAERAALEAGLTQVESDGSYDSNDILCTDDQVSVGPSTK